MSAPTSKWLLAGTLSVVMVLGVGITASQAHLGRRGVDLQQALGLTDDQARAVHQIHGRQWAERRQLRKSLGEAQRSLRELVLQGADDAAIQSKVSEVRDLLTQAVQLRVTTLREVSQVLTPEQRDKLRELRPGRRPGPLAPAG